MNVFVRALALAVLSAMTAFADPLPVDAQSTPAEITFGSLGAMSAEWPMFIAEAQGFYKDEGQMFCSRRSISSTAASRGAAHPRSGRRSRGYIICAYR